MIKGIGTDILQIDRMRSMYECETKTFEAFFDKCFTENERTNAETRNDPALYFAGRFAGKEAVIKCLSMIGNDIRLGNIEILNHESGKPYVSLLNELVEATARADITDIQISLSYDMDYVVAFAIAVG